MTHIQKKFMAIRFMATRFHNPYIIIIYIYKGKKDNINGLMGSMLTHLTTGYARHIQFATLIVCVADFERGNINKEHKIGLKIVITYDTNKFNYLII